MIYDRVGNLEQYCTEGDAVARAVRFVQEFDLTQPDGRYEIEGETMFANVESVVTQPAKERVFEAHRTYMDVQMVLVGRERQDVVLIEEEGIEITQPYDREKDVMFFEAGEYAQLVLRPGMFVVYRLGDGHRPCCCVEEPESIRKVCVKIVLVDE